MLETLLNCLLAFDTFRRLRHRKKHSCVISETGNELLDIEVFERAQKLSSECFNGCSIDGLVRLEGTCQRGHRGQNCNHQNNGAFANHRHKRRCLKSPSPLTLLPSAHEITL